MTVTQFIIFIIYLVLFVGSLFLLSTLWEKVKETYLAAIRADFYSKQKYNLFEITIPKGQSKSPLAMEVFLNALYQPQGEGNWMDIWLKGSTKAWFSLELVSIEGQVRFFIWTREGFSATIKTQLYAQFPDIGIKEIYQGDYKNDYVAGIDYDISKYKFSCSEFKKKNAGHLPIKTYVDYGLDKDPKEEFKIDPITPVLEYLGSLGQGEQAWIQIGLKAPGKNISKPMPADAKEAEKFKKDYKLKWYQSEAKVDWTDAAKDDLKKLTKRDKKVDKENPGNPADMKLTKQEQEKVDAVERGLSKLAFDTCIRVIYLAKKDVFSPANSAGLGGVFKQYNTQHLNSFESKSPSVKYAIQDPGGVRVETDKRMIFEQYKARAFFYEEFIPVGASSYYGTWKTNQFKLKKDKYKPTVPFIMTTEEVATIFHFPGDTATNSNVSRVEAKKVEAPSNLPI
jgi:hypothetical protein